MKPIKFDLWYQNFISSTQGEGAFSTLADLRGDIQRIHKIYSDEFLKAKKIDSIEAYEDYMTTYPKSDHLPNCLED